MRNNMTIYKELEQKLEKMTKGEVMGMSNAGMDLCEKMILEYHQWRASQSDTPLDDRDVVPWDEAENEDEAAYKQEREDARAEEHYAPSEPY